ncbi:energy transducer TonB [Ferrigenium sp. UT5]|uniref:energy transducer TonB n=1 Tax=Ferrigenium sp. UT5 TaxID=3242105 RepID=UPI003552C028
MTKRAAIALLTQERLAFAIACSFLLHAFVLFGITFSLPDARSLAKKLQPLEVTLVNSQSRTKPDKATAYAQRSLDGGGNTPDEVRAGTPFPVLGKDPNFTPEQAAQRTKALEREVKQLLARNKSDYRIEPQKVAPKKTDSTLSGEELVQRSLEIARLEAEISKNISFYEKLPKRKRIGARTEEYRYAQYVEDWRAKVEQIGNLNYPEAARRQKVFGSLLLTVNIRADGSVESVEINKSSGQRILDAAAQKIVRLAAPYTPFPPDIRKETDILSITRTWTFTTNDRLQAE